MRSRGRCAAYLAERGRAPADLLALDLDPDQAYRVAIGEATIVDAEADVTYSSPVSLHAIGPRIEIPTGAKETMRDA